MRDVDEKCPSPDDGLTPAPIDMSGDEFSRGGWSVTEEVGPSRLERAIVRGLVWAWTGWTNWLRTTFGPQ